MIPLEQQPSDGLRVTLCDPRSLSLIKDVIHEDLVVVENNSESEVSPETVLNQCLSGIWRMWLVGYADQYKGFAVTEDIITEQGVWMNITHLHCKKDLGALNYLMDSLEQVAKDCGYRGVKLVSSVPGVGTYSRRRGYKIRFIEFVNEFGE